MGEPNPAFAIGDSERPRGGELNAALTGEVVRIHTANIGRGPKRSTTFHHGNVVVTVLQEAMTKAERSLARNGNDDAVLAIRRLFKTRWAKSSRGAWSS